MFITLQELVTPRLLLRQLQPEDEQEVFSFRSDERVGKYLSRPLEESLDSTRYFIDNINEGIRKEGWLYWGLALRPQNKIIGTICFWNISSADHCAEIGYELHPDFQKKGLMQEAIHVVLRYGFEEMRFQRIEACLQRDNLASVRLLERNGFQFLRTVGEEEKFAAEAGVQLIAYGLEREDWETSA